MKKRNYNLMKAEYNVINKASLVIQNLTKKEAVNLCEYFNSALESLTDFPFGDYFFVAKEKKKKPLTDTREQQHEVSQTATALETDERPHEMGRERTSKKRITPTKTI